MRRRDRTTSESDEIPNEASQIKNDKKDQS